MYGKAVWLASNASVLLQRNGGFRQVVIIGEKINGADPAVARAIELRDGGAIQMFAKKQERYGADYLEVCAATSPGREPGDLQWLIEEVQQASELPLCIDSPDVELIIKMLPLAKRPGIVNSVSMEKNKCDRLMPRIAGSNWKVIALTCNDEGIPGEPKQKLEIAQQLVDKAKSYGIGSHRLLIDPLVMPVSASPNAVESFVETTRELRVRYPKIHIVSGVSNISYGMPLRGEVNRQFLPLAMGAGMDYGIVDVLSPGMRAAYYASSALLGQDKNGREYLKAFRGGLLDPEEM